MVQLPAAVLKRQKRRAMSMNMKAAVLHEVAGPSSIEDVELLPPEPAEVCARLAAFGTCHSDWHFVTGNLTRDMPLVLAQSIGFDDNRELFHKMFQTWADAIKYDHPEGQYADLETSAGTKELSQFVSVSCFRSLALVSRGLSQVDS